MKPSWLYDAYELKHALKVKRWVQGTLLSWTILFGVGNYLMVFFILKQTDFTEGFLNDRIVGGNKKRREKMTCILFNPFV